MMKRNSLESKDFVDDTRDNTAAEVFEKRALSTHRVKNGQAFISIETSSVEDVNRVATSVTPSGGAYDLVGNKRIAGVKPRN